MRLPRSERVFATLVGLLALCLYLRTLYPGLVGDGDTPKFQYVGAVSGTPHNPGYPLYLVLSYAFSRLPAGNLAWRINLMSAVCGALAVALLALLQRALGCDRLVSAALALLAACGPIFWSQATLAEVYTLAAALLLGVLLPLVHWGRTHQAWLLLTAASVFALALGHHLTVLMVAPAIFLYVLVTDRRAALRPRVLIGAALLQLAGLCQYLLILVRTRQGAPYLGSQARTLLDLVDVVRAKQFGNRLSAPGLGELWHERLPLVAGLLSRELGLAGLALGLAGFVLLARRRPREGLLLGVGALGVLVFALVYRVDDTAVFLIPAFVLVWPAVGVALQTLADRLRDVARPWPRGRAVAPLVLLGLPLFQLTSHFKASDHSDRTFEMRYFRAAVESVPVGSVFLAESYTIDQMLLYELLGEGFAQRRGLRLVSNDAESAEVYAGLGLPVFAFARTRRALAPQGFRFAPLSIEDSPLPQALARLPRGYSVLIATPAMTPGLRAAARAVGADVAADADAFLLAAVTGEAGPRVVSGAPPLDLRVETPRGPASLHVAATRQATLLLEGRGPLESDSGAVAAWLNPAGRVVEALELDPSGRLTVPFGRRAFPFYHLVRLPDGSPAR